MNPERWRQIKQLYNSVLEQDTARRYLFLAKACRDDPDLLREVQSLLAQTASTAELAGKIAAVAADAFEGSENTLKQGETLGPYEIRGLLGTGGMARVYLAVDTRLGRRVAVKVSQERFTKRFKREARATSMLNHPNICTLYDIGSNYLVTEFVEGETLHDMLKRAAPVDRAREIGRQVLEALRAAHREGIVHRDLKPANIMVRFDGYVKVLDFGLAKWTASGSGGHIESTATGQLVGTLAYMSPEQILGERVDPRSDLFAFGIILYEMLTGRHPWVRKSPMDTLQAILNDDPPLMEPTSPLVTELTPVLQKLLCKNPAERYPTAEVVLESVARRP